MCFAVRRKRLRARRRALHFSERKPEPWPRFLSLQRTCWGNNDDVNLMFFVFLLACDYRLIGKYHEVYLQNQ